jgi:hypothetical protein
VIASTRLSRRCRPTIALLVAAWILPGPAAAGDRIDALIERVEAQDREIQALRKEVQELRENPRPPPEHPDYRREDGDEPLTDYQNPRIRLDLSGQINQAFNFAGDGKNAKGYFVDNDTTNTRMRFAGVSMWEEGPQVGTTLEIAFSPNNSFDVSQDNEVAGDFFQVRRAELWARDDRYGRVMFGQGSAAADNTAEFDLSLISGMIMTSGVSFIAGGLQLTDGHSLTGVTLGDAFFNFDGDRQERIRYDSPMLGPVQLSVSAGADQRYDAALTFGGDYDHWSGMDLGPFTGLGAVSIRQPNQEDVDYTVAGSWSLLHDASGLSLTLSGGFDGGARGDTPYSLYGKLGWNAKLVPVGPTGFGVDYAWTENVSADGDRGQSVGLAAVQVLQRYGIELYGQLRWYTVDRAASPAFDDIYLGTLGTRVRF